MPRRYALVGTGSRAQMYLDALAGAHADAGTLAAWTDTNPGRLDWSERHHPALGRPRRFAPGELDAIVREERIDAVIVTAPDMLHAPFVVAALDAGADAIVEKPLTIDEEGVRAIADAVERTGRDVTITFNYRYAPRNGALKRVIASGEIGEVTSIDFSWMLDTAHGADYFRRWHREKRNSGGLLVHKASHHFDLVNWWTELVPSRVFASGGLRFYGAANAAAFGLAERADRGSTDDPRTDAFSLDLRRDDLLRGLYFDQEHHDGYVRDQDVFSEGITIEDNLALIVDYVGGATLSYSLNAHAPWEGYTVAVNGTKGRAELTVVERGGVILDEEGQVVVDPSARPDLVAANAARAEADRLVVQTHFQPARDVEIASDAGGHGGGDALLLDELFRGTKADPLGRTADWTDGVRSVVVGIAGNRSLDSRMPVAVAELDLGHAARTLDDAGNAL